MDASDFTLSQKTLLDLFCYEDGKLFWKKSGSGITVGQIAGTKTSDGYFETWIKGKRYGNHRLIFMMFHGYFPLQVDHIDGVRTNNFIENLRAASQEQNQQNAKIRKDNVSGVKGVHWYKKYNKWNAMCQTNKKRQNLGYFDTIEEAEKAVKSYREQHHGEFARHS